MARMRTIVILIALIASTAVSANARERRDTTFVQSSRTVLFRPNYTREVEKMYVDGKLKRKRIAINCTGCTYSYTIRARTRNYR